MLRRALAAWVGVWLALAAQVPAAGAQQNSGAAPIFLRIPKIGTAARVVPLGMDADGALDAPSDPDTVGWFAPGAGVGAPGNAILDGHVDWGGRLRVFGLLRTLRPGDEVLVTDQNGQALRYSVTWIRLVDAETAPIDEIYAQGENEELTLITCGGAFDPALHMYVSRWIVRAQRDLSADGSSGPAQREVGFSAD
jgi:LPXTG-site transpeptidase (sortase) family protein